MVSTPEACVAWKSGEAQRAEKVTAARTERVSAPVRVSFEVKNINVNPPSYPADRNSSLTVKGFGGGNTLKTLTLRGLRILLSAARISQGPVAAGSVYIRP